MKRFAIDELNKWRDSSHRKPLLLLGARQVGKTWLLKEFGKSFEDRFVHIDFDKQPEFKQFFEQSKDPYRIVENLSLACGKNITEKTLIIFDEIQECPEALNALKYFCEDAPQYPVAGAGSLLGVALTTGFPVGKVNIQKLGPLSFEEFLLACGDERLVNYLRSIDSVSPVFDAFSGPLTEKLKAYFIVGGMPEAVSAWAEDRDISKVDDILSDILRSYEMDFGKHAALADVPKIGYVWDSLPSQLARDNKKFLYSAVKTGARAREYENAVVWLDKADLVRKVSKITKPGVPLSSYEDLSSFKLYMPDVGLLRRKAHLSSAAFLENNRLFTEFKGALTENYVLQSLSGQLDSSPYYWADARNEVDFIIQNGNDIVPIEVKSGESVGAASIKKFLAQNESLIPFGIRLSLKNFTKDGKILNVPLYLADELLRIVSF